MPVRPIPECLPCLCFIHAPNERPASKFLDEIAPAIFARNLYAYSIAPTFDCRKETQLDEWRLAGPTLVEVLMERLQMHFSFCDDGSQQANELLCLMRRVMLKLHDHFAAIVCHDEVKYTALVFNVDSFFTAYVLACRYEMRENGFLGTNFGAPVNRHVLEQRQAIVVGLEVIA